jgi:GntR family transcriptional repressor for pyruvate dehydrogenase complex
MQFLIRGLKLLLEKKHMIYDVLKIISKSRTPVGSGFVRDNLELEGFDVSEATVGRLLRDLDIKGYTEKVGFKGRSITSLGQQRLIKLEHEYRINKYGNELLNVIRITGKQELLDVLIARKAIESQLAKLAAKHITLVKLKELEKIIKDQQNHLKNGISIADDDVKFHKAIACAAKNRVLDAALDLIRQHGQLSPVFEYIRKEIKSTVFLDHKNIYKAIASRNPELSEKAMIIHIENLENDVEKYWEIVNKDVNGGPA